MTASSDEYGDGTGDSHADLPAIHRWSETKLKILEEYAVPYSRILAKSGLQHIYIDGFAGKGLYRSLDTGDVVEGSALRVLGIQPPFLEYHFVDLEPKHIAAFRKRVGDRKDVFLYQGDANQILLTEVFPRAMREDYKRALCFLDPYGLHLTWDVIRRAAELRTIDIFVNFSIMDINRNAKGKREDSRLTALWGDESWRPLLLRVEPSGLFPGLILEERVPGNEPIVHGFEKRLRAAGFAHVAPPVAMRNSIGAAVYYLFFATQNPIGLRIASSVLKKHAG